MMTLDEIANAAARLSPAQKQRLLARLSFELTIAARDTYVPGTEDIAAPRQIRALNEIQHRVTGCLLDLMDNSTAELWIWPVIAELSEAAGCAAQAAQACFRALASLGSSAVHLTETQNGSIA
jgi:hypothetical protein